MVHFSAPHNKFLCGASCCAPYDASSRRLEQVHDHHLDAVEDSKNHRHQGWHAAGSRDCLAHSHDKAPGNLVWVSSAVAFLLLAASTLDHLHRSLVHDARIVHLAPPRCPRVVHDGQDGRVLPHIAVGSRPRAEANNSVLHQKKWFVILVSENYRNSYRPGVFY